MYRCYLDLCQEDSEVSKRFGRPPEAAMALEKLELNPDESVAFGDFAKGPRVPSRLAPPALWLYLVTDMYRQN
jgi:hypothetical protein